jgi:hypothetical protein
MRLVSAALAISVSLPSFAQFTLQNSNSTADLRGIHNVGGGVAWASGTNGTVLRTEDGGYVWQSCSIPPGAEKLDFRGVQGFDANSAIVMSSGPGDQSRLYKTTDGCHSWKLIFTNPDKDGFWDAVRIDKEKPAVATVSWVNQMYGVLIGDPVNGIFSIWETHDSGSHWERFNANDTKHQPKSEKNESLFAASNGALAVPGNNAGFTFVTGGGSTRICSGSVHSPFDAAFWIAVGCNRLPFPLGPSAGAFALGTRPVKGSHGESYHDILVVGGDYGHPSAQSPSLFFPGLPRILLGYRRGQESTTPPHGYRSAVAYDPSTKTWITVGPNGTDISTDDGRNWRPVHPNAALHEAPDADRNWNALSLPYVVGPHGRIGKLDGAALKR